MAHKDNLAQPVWRVVPGSGPVFPKGKFNPLAEGMDTGRSPANASVHAVIPVSDASSLKVDFSAPTTSEGTISNGVISEPNTPFYTTAGRSPKFKHGRK